MSLDISIVLLKKANNNTCLQYNDNPNNEFKYIQHTYPVVPAVLDKNRGLFIKWAKPKSTSAKFNLSYAFCMLAIIIFSGLISNTDKKYPSLRVSNALLIWICKTINYSIFNNDILHNFKTHYTYIYIHVHTIIFTMINWISVCDSLGM